MLSISVGQTVREHRLIHGLTQDDLARTVRTFGLRWTASRVSELEAGCLPLNLPALLVLAAAMTALVPGSATSVLSLVGNERLPITDRWSARADSISAMVIGGEAPDPTANTEPNSNKSRFMKGMPPGMSLKAASDTAAREPSLAEKRAAKRLDITPELLVLWASHLWSKSLDDQAGALAGDARPTPQTRGYFTRGLVKELDEAIPRNARKKAF